MLKIHSSHPFKTLGTLGLLVALGCSGSDTETGFSGFVTQTAVVADLDGGGKLDILTANAVYANGASSAGFLTTRLQQAAAPGSFLDPLRTDTGRYPLAIAVGDVNGDNRPDAVVACYLATSGTYAVDVHLQSATVAGTFQAPLRLSVGNRRPLDVTLADLKGEGRLDIVVAASGSNDVLVFFHDTAPGTFLAPLSLAVSGDPAAVAVANLAGSGALDIAVAMANGKVAVLVQGATVGTFETPVEYVTGWDPVALKVADLDGDGRLDLLTANYSNGTGGFSFLRQSPTQAGVFLAAQTFDTEDYASTSLAIGDVNGDGVLDVVVANAGLPGYTGSVSVFLQYSSGGGELFAPDLYRGYYGPISVAIADLRGDGKPALVVADGDPAIRWPDPANPGMFLPPVWLKQ